MSRTCTICNHPRVLEINTALAQNEAYRHVSKRFGVSASAMYRHQHEHLPAAPTNLTEPMDEDEGGLMACLLGKITRLEAEARRLGKKAEDAGDFRGAMAAVRELVRIVELLARMHGELQEPSGTTVNVVYVNPPGLDITPRSGAIAVSEGLPEPGQQITSAASSIVKVRTSARQSRLKES